mgnify:CR=1 FL=1
MKKLMAMLLSCAMVLSAMLAMTAPVSAMGENETFPMLYETY